MNVSKRYNVCLAKNIDGQEKPIWKQVGKIVEFENGKQILELNHINEVYQVFEQTEETTKDKPTTQPAKEKIPVVEPKDEEIKACDIPFN